MQVRNVPSGIPVLIEIMANEYVQVDWIRDKVFLLKDRNDFQIVMTQPQGVNGADLLPLSLAGCSAWDVVDIIQKQRQHITGLQVLVASEREENPPWRFKKIHLHFKFSGCDLVERQIERAIELSNTKYCSIYATLQPAVELSSDYEIVGRQV
jgi:putative redox protein